MLEKENMSFINSGSPSAFVLPQTSSPTPMMMNRTTASSIATPPSSSPSSPVRRSPVRHSQFLSPIDLSEFEPRPSTPIKSRLSPDKKPICTGFCDPIPIRSSSNAQDSTLDHFNSRTFSSTTTNSSANNGNLIGNTNRTNSISNKRVFQANNQPTFNPSPTTGNGQQLFRPKNRFNNNSASNSPSSVSITRPTSTPTNKPSTPVIANSTITSSNTNSNKQRNNDNSFISGIINSTSTKSNVGNTSLSQSINNSSNSSIIFSSSPIPLRAKVTSEAILRKKQILPGAPNPPTSPLPASSTINTAATNNQTISNIFSSNPNTPTNHHQLQFKSNHTNNTLQTPQSSSTKNFHASPTIFGTPIDNSISINNNNKVVDENVLVSIRVKPDLDRNKEQSLRPRSGGKAWKFDDESIGLVSGSDGNDEGFNQAGSNPDSQWKFDAVLGPESNNYDVYDRSGAKDLISSAMSGYDATIFAYGQTASGKTHTLSGNNQQPGILPLSVQDIFAYIRSNPEREFLLRVSYLEIYNEQINDLLLPPNTQPQPIRIRQTTKGHFFPDPIREELVTDLSQVQTLIRRGEVNRHVAGTDFNSRSSRSHTVFGIVIESRLANNYEQGGRNYGHESDQVGSVNRSKVFLIDLAGNERASSEAERRSEGGFINKSLLTLEKVISALITPSSTTKKNPTRPMNNYIPFRDSKLTQILQPSLLGESKVCVICTIDTNLRSLEDSKSTLRFASRVKKVEIRAGKKEILSEKALLTQYQTQIVDLQTQLNEAMKMISMISNNNNNFSSRVEDCNNQQENRSSLGDEERLKKVEEERLKILNKLNDLQSIVLNANSLDKFSRSEKSRPISPTKIRNEINFERVESEYEESEENEDEDEDEKKLKLKEQRTMIDLQAHQISCLEFELTKLSKKFCTLKNKNKQFVKGGCRRGQLVEGQEDEGGDKSDEKEDEDQLTDNYDEDEDEDYYYDLDVEGAKDRVKKTRENLDIRFDELKNEIEARKKFGDQVMKLLDESRTKTKKLELFVINELERSTKQLKLNRKSKGGEEGRKEDKNGRSRRRRSSSLSVLNQIKSEDQQQKQQKQQQRENNGLKKSKSKVDEWDFKCELNEDEGEDEEEEDEIERMLSIVNEVPELEFVRMSFGFEKS